ncbi:hypothetical protein [Sphingomonas sp.]|uniref:hypothetical protein n=1 Tax=Sphingomonas sp. TaxID=28214 RepID=UPI002DD685FB|nr:hypothetical protein [Sphingomonas sp.]
MTLHDDVHARIARMAARPDAASPAALNDMLRLMAKWRSAMIQNTILKQDGTVVPRGPLAGLDFLERSAEGCHAAKLIGTYEQPLHPHVKAAIAGGYDTILNIGCAEGYYAVGMARRMPETRALAFDLDPNARATCAALATRNGVADRITIGELFTPADFAVHAGARTLVFCDIEGGEDALLDPLAAPALAGMDLIVESHECLKPGLTRRLCDRFAATHDITVVEDDGQRGIADAPEWFRGLAHLDQLLATWEWRSGPTPWLVMTAR